MTSKRKKSSRNPAKPARKEQTFVWIKTEPTLMGETFMVTIEIDEDNAIVLDREKANAYAYAILETVARAEYDAAVYRQISTLTDPASGGQIVRDLRLDRPDIDYSVMAPMSFEYGVNEKTKPFLTILIKGERIGQWEVKDARTHALGVLESIVAAELDSGYLRILRGVVGLDEVPSRSAVEALAKWRNS